MSAAPALVTLPVNYAVYDLRPFDVPTYVLRVICQMSVTNPFQGSRYWFCWAYLSHDPCGKPYFSTLSSLLTGYCVVHINGESDSTSCRSNLNLNTFLQNHLFAADAQSGFGRRLTLRSLIVIRLLWPFLVYFFISVSKPLHAMMSPSPHVCSSCIVCWAWHLVYHLDDSESVVLLLSERILILT